MWVNTHHFLLRRILMNKNTVKLLKIMQERINETGMCTTEDVMNCDKIDLNKLRESYEDLEKRFLLENKGGVCGKRSYESFVIMELPIEATDFLNQGIMDKLRYNIVKNAPIMSVIMFIIIVFTFILRLR